VVFTIFWGHQVGQGRPFKEKGGQVNQEMVNNEKKNEMGHLVDNPGQRRLSRNRITKKEAQRRGALEERRGNLSEWGEVAVEKKTS